MLYLSNNIGCIFFFFCQYLYISYSIDFTRQLYYLIAVSKDLQTLICSGPSTLLCFFCRMPSIQYTQVQCCLPIRAIAAPAKQTKQKERSFEKI